MEKEPTIVIRQLPSPINLTPILQEQMIVNSFFGGIPNCYSEDIFELLDGMLEED